MISAEKAAQMRELLKAGKQCREVARVLKLSPMTVCRYRDRFGIVSEKWVRGVPQIRRPRPRPRGDKPCPALTLRDLIEQMQRPHYVPPDDPGRSHAKQGWRGLSAQYLYGESALDPSFAMGPRLP